MPGGPQLSLEGAIAMPIYEYYCEDCRANLSIWFRSIAQAETQPAACTACGSDRLIRLVSHVAIAHSADRSAAQPSAATGDEPQSLARAMHAASAGRDMGNDFHEVAARLEKGE